jgi:hypothetical protein
MIIAKVCMVTRLHSLQHDETDGDMEMKGRIRRNHWAMDNKGSMNCN